MFEFLKTVDVDQAIGGAYYAMRLIKRRADFAESKNGRSFEWILAGPSPDKQELALKIIHAIELAEKRPLTSLSDSTVEKYIDQFSDIALEQVRKELTDKDIKRGEKLLQELRQSGTFTAQNPLKSSPRRRNYGNRRSPSPKRAKSVQTAAARA
jgi:hypothetical protein